MRRGLERDEAERLRERRVHEAMDAAVELLHVAHGAAESHALRDPERARERLQALELRPRAGDVQLDVERLARASACTACSTIATPLTG